MVEWPTGQSNFTDDRPRLGVVTVKWNTRDLLARMLYSVLRVVESGTITEVVVVDNASNDGSREVAQRLADEGIIRFIGNDTQRYQRLGGGLNEAKRLYEQGWSLARMAAQFDVNAGSVVNAFSRAGVATRRLGPISGSLVVEPACVASSREPSQRRGSRWNVHSTIRAFAWRLVRCQRLDRGQDVCTCSCQPSVGC
jgi:hypothetical protein